MIIYKKKVIKIHKNYIKNKKVIIENKYFPNNSAAN